MPIALSRSPDGLKDFFNFLINENDKWSSLLLCCSSCSWRSWYAFPKLLIGPKTDSGVSQTPMLLLFIIYTIKLLALQNSKKKPSGYWSSGKNLGSRSLLSLWSQVRALWLLIWWPLEAYMIVNFRARGINRGARKLARTPTLN
jgi:hypothetical protein